MLVLPTGLSLEDMNELFAQDNIRAKFTPSRQAVIQADRDFKDDEGPHVQHVDNVSRV